MATTLNYHKLLLSYTQISSITQYGWGPFSMIFLVLLTLGPSPKHSDKPMKEALGYSMMLFKLCNMMPTSLGHHVDQPSQHQKKGVPSCK